MQNPGGEVAHIVDAGAAMRVEPIIVGEQFAHVSVVHVNRIPIRHVDLEIAECVPGAGILAHGEIRRP